MKLILVLTVLLVILLTIMLRSQSSKERMKMTAQVIIPDCLSTAVCNSTIYSKDNTKRLVMQTDGNLVVYDDTAGGKAVWDSGTWRSGTANGPYKLTMQDDGNLVIYNKDNKPIWDKGAISLLSRNGPYGLRVLNDGNFCIYDKDGKVVWKARDMVAPSFILPDKAVDDTTKLVDTVGTSGDWTSLFTNYNNALSLMENFGQKVGKDDSYFNANFVRLNDQFMAKFKEFINGSTCRDAATNMDRLRQILTNWWNIKTDSYNAMLTLYKDQVNGLTVKGCTLNAPAFSTYNVLSNNSCFNGRCQDTIVSQNGVYRLEMQQTDGHLVLRDNTNKVLWTGEPFGGSRPWRLMVQTDGNIVVYDNDGKPWWNSGTSNLGPANSPYYLYLDNNGNLNLYNKNMTMTSIFKR